MQQRNPVTQWHNQKYRYVFMTYREVRDVKKCERESAKEDEGKRHRGKVRDVHREKNIAHLWWDGYSRWRMNQKEVLKVQPNDFHFLNKSYCFKEIQISLNRNVSQNGRWKRFKERNWAYRDRTGTFLFIVYILGDKIKMSYLFVRQSCHFALLFQS